MFPDNKRAMLEMVERLKIIFGGAIKSFNSEEPTTLPINSAIKWSVNDSKPFQTLRVSSYRVDEYAEEWLDELLRGVSGVQPGERIITGLDLLH